MANKPAPALTGVEDILITALDESKQQHRASLLQVKAKHLVGWLEAHSLENARRAAELSDEDIGQIFVSHFEERAPDVSEAIWNDGYRQACEDCLVEIQAFLKGLN